MEALKIVVFATLAAVVFGIVHDQLTVRVSLEYFTIGHPRVFETTDPTLLALGWGVIATWWAGAAIGIVLAIAARAGARPPVPARRLVRPVLLLLAVMAASSLVAGVVGAQFARNGLVVLVAPFAERIPKDRHIAFLADLWAHSASYFAGFAGGIVVAWRTYRSRALPGVPAGRLEARRLGASRAQSRVGSS